MKLYIMVKAPESCVDVHGLTYTLSMHAASIDSEAVLMHMTRRILIAI